jgi:2-methylcitrate dehydratase PrpD
VTFPPPKSELMTQSEALAAFALGLQYDSVPPEVLSLAKGHFLDVLGIALASSRFDFGTAILEGTRQLGDGSAARALASGVRLPAASAALVNGTLSHGLDFDDTHIAAIYHASAPAFGASLAAGEAAGADGRAVLLAYIVALEIGCRLAAGGAGAFHDRGFHPTSQCGTFAAAAAAARLAGDSVPNLVNALGLCGSMASGILEIRESWLKRLHPGWAAHAGLVAVALARSGFRGPATVLEGPLGFYACHISKVPVGDQSPAHDLSEQWATLGIALKPYPCCHFTHAFIDAALVLRDKVALADIERIDCPLTDRLQPMVGEPRERRIKPPTIYDALFSVPYVVALALIKGRVDIASFYDDPLDDPQVLALAERIYCPNDPDSDYPAHFPGEVRIKLKNGREIRRREPTSRGTPERRLTAAEIEAKFHANATRAVTRKQAAHIASLVWDLENLGDIRTLVSACVVEQGGR